MAAAAACRGSTPTGGSGRDLNALLSRNNRGPESCTQFCAKTYAHNCDAEISVYGNVGNATRNEQIVGMRTLGEEQGKQRLLKRKSCNSRKVPSVSSAVSVRCYQRKRFLKHIFSSIRK